MFYAEVTMARGEVVPDPDSIHKRIRDEIFADVEKQGKAGKVVVEGTICENPFPKWLARGLIDNGFMYEKTNMSYFQLVEKEEKVDEMISWFDSVFRAWIRKKAVSVGGMSEIEAEKLDKRILFRAAERDRSLDEEKIERF